MRAGLRYARHSPVFQAVLVRTAAFFCSRAPPGRSCRSSCGRWQVDGFAARPVLNGGDVFDSRRDPNQALWSVYGSGKPSDLPGAALDLYYLGFQDDQGDYVQSTASETRHSVGGRLWGKAAGWDYNFESLFQ